MILNSQSEEFNVLLYVRFDDFDYTLWTRSSVVKCFGCGQEGPARPRLLLWSDAWESGSEYCRAVESAAGPQKNTETGTKPLLGVVNRCESLRKMS